VVTGAVLAAGTVAGFPQARQSIVRPTLSAPAVSRSPHTGHAKRILASTGAGAAGPDVFPHLGQPAGLVWAS